VFPRTLLRIAAPLTAIASFATFAVGQAPRVDLSGPFLQVGGLVGSSSGESGPVDQSDNGFGWSVGGGVGLNRHIAAVGNYATLQVKPPTARSYDVEQSEVGLRLRFGGVNTPALFYVEGGGALRRARRPSVDVFGDDIPAGVDSIVEVSGLAGWFGPGVQLFMNRRVGAEVTAAWAWGDLTKARIPGDDLELEKPIGVITLRLRAAVVVALF
jgi:hypothetical protein